MRPLKFAQIALLQTVKPFSFPTPHPQWLAPRRWLFLAMHTLTLFAAANPLFERAAPAFMMAVGGTRAAALAHLSRTICRRAERSIVHLGHNEAVSDHARQYLNRLSDLLFVIGRTLNRAGGNGDVLWKTNRSQ